MNTIDVSSWSEFEVQLKELRSKYNKPWSPLLFRGQANSEWRLETTLDRNQTGRMSFTDYYRLICSTGPEVSSFAKVVPPKPDNAVIETFSDPMWFTDLDRFPSDVYGYMAYLRHFGFPSPLLDWSRSPYVAAFFAFRNYPACGSCSVYVYCEQPNDSKSIDFEEASILPMGPYIATHNRHFRQRCDYTICAIFDREQKQWFYDSHQKVFDYQNQEQNYLWKFDLPTTLAIDVLNRLSEYNLNAFSLFGSEESLLETMWFREYVLKDADLNPIVSQGNN